MAEIKIEKKAPKWPWIILILVIVAVLLYLFAFNDEEEIEERQVVLTEQTIEEGTEQVALNNPTVAAYVTFIKEDPNPMGLDHEFTNEALLTLGNAISAVADEIGYDIKKDVARAKTLSEKITKDPFETTHANSIKEVASIWANALQNIQQAAFPGLTSEAEEVKNTVAAIETEELTLDQKEDVKKFFRASADLLEKMNNNSPQK